MSANFQITGPSTVTLLPAGVRLIYTDIDGDSIYVARSDSGEWPPALHIGQPDATQAVLMPTDPAELDALLAAIRDAVLEAADGPPVVGSVGD